MIFKVGTLVASVVQLVEQPTLNFAQFFSCDINREVASSLVAAGRELLHDTGQSFIVGADACGKRARPAKRAWPDSASPA